MASTYYRKALADNPDLKDDKDAKKKLRGRLVVNARLAVGAGKKKINITDKEWEAIQAGAVSDSVLRSILKNADGDRVRQLATPRNERKGLTDTQASLIERMADRGYTRNDIAERMGITIGAVNYALMDSNKLN